ARCIAPDFATPDFCHSPPQEWQQAYDRTTCTERPEFWGKGRGMTIIETRNGRRARRHRLRSIALAVLLAGVAGGLAATPARAKDHDWRGDEHHEGWHHWREHHWREWQHYRPVPGYYYVAPPPVVYAAPPPVYAPPPVVYAPPPVIYAPPPAVYAPPTSIDLVFPLHFH